MSTAERILQVARAQIGYHEGRSGGHWNNREKYAAEVPTLAWVDAGGFPWCAVFVCWAFAQAGALGLIPGGATAAVEHFRDYAKKAGRFSEYPAIGAIALFGRDGGAHTGIVESFTATSVTTIEGNTNTSGSAEGDGVYRKTHSRTDPWVYGYAYPTYPEGIDSADPAWAPAKPRPLTAKHKAPQPAPGSRGAAVEHALDDLSRVSGSPRRRSVAAKAAQLLRSLPVIRRR